MWERCLRLVQLLPVGLSAGALIGLSRLSETVACEPQSLQHSSAAPPWEDAELKLVQVVFRHGARTPLTPRYWEGQAWEKGPICGSLYDAIQLHVLDVNGGPRPQSLHDKQQADTELPGGCTKGELTLLGQEQARELGEWLRQRYMQSLGFLPSHYTEGAVAGRSTNFRRTVATLQGVLTGLFPDDSGPAAVTTSSDVDEIMFANMGTCSRLGEILKLQGEALRARSAKDPQTQDLEQRIRRAMGMPKDERIHFTDLHDALTTLRSHGKPIPPGLTPQLLEEIEREATKRMQVFVAPPPGLAMREQTLQLSMGRLFEQIVLRMEEARRGQAAGARMYLYSGHDTTVMPVLVTLGVDLQHWPGYVSNVVFELWQRNADGSQWVRVLYNREELNLGGKEQGELMTLDDFTARFFKPFILSEADRQRQCRAVLKHDRPMPQVDAQVGTSGSSGGDSLQGI